MRGMLLLLLLAVGAWQLAGCDPRAVTESLEGEGGAPQVLDAGGERSFCSGQARGALADGDSPILLTGTDFHRYTISTPPVPPGVEIDPDDYCSVDGVVITLSSAGSSEVFTLRVSGCSDELQRAFRAGGLDLGAPTDLQISLEFGFILETKGGTAQVEQSSLSGWLRFQDFPPSVFEDCASCALSLCVTAPWRIYAGGVTGS